MLCTASRPFIRLADLDAHFASFQASAFWKDIYSFSPFNFVSIWTCVSVSAINATFMLGGKKDPSCFKDALICRAFRKRVKCDKCVEQLQPCHLKGEFST